MIQRSTRTTRPDTLFPYTTLFRSRQQHRQCINGKDQSPRGYVTQQGRQCVDNQLNATGLLQAKTYSQHPEDEDENIAVQRTPRFFGVNAAGDQNRPDRQNGCDSNRNDIQRGKEHDTGKRRKGDGRSEEHTYELQSLMRNSYAVFCLKKKK